MASSPIVHSVMFWLIRTQEQHYQEGRRDLRAAPVLKTVLQQSHSPWGPNGSEAGGETSAETARLSLLLIRRYLDKKTSRTIEMIR